MAKKFTLSALVFVLSILIFSGGYTSNKDTITKFYYYQGKKFNLKLNLDKIFFKFDNKISKDAFRNLVGTNNGMFDVSAFNGNEDAQIVRLNTSQTETSIQDFIENLKSTRNFECVSPVYSMPDGQGNPEVEIGVENEIIVQFKSGLSDNKINDFLRNKNLIISQTLDLSGGKSFILKVPSNTFAVNAANEVFESDMVNFSEPNFFQTHLPNYVPNDPFIGNQWSVKNTSTNVPDGITGTADCDMDVDSAWNISLGSNSVIVGLVDSGIDTLHPDLQNKIVFGKGYNFYSNNTNSMDDFNHGTCCAGIIAAEGNNSLGVSGIAPNARIFGIKIFNSAGSTTSTAIINALVYTKTSGCWISSNSWGGGSPIAAADNALLDGVTNGRSGKGVVYCFASGNSNTGSISWPSTNPNVIAVGGVSPCNQRKSPTSCDGENWWGAQYGTGLTVVAPCVKIYATDRRGANGYDPTDYFATFNGTSSATPNTAGVCALALGLDPNMRWDTLRSRISRFADKVGGYSYTAAGYLGLGQWNNEMGYGKVNAYRVLKYTLSQLNPTVCEDFSTTTLPPNGWTEEFAGTNYWTRNLVSSYGIGSGSAKFDFASAGVGIDQSIITYEISASVAGTYLTFDEAYAAWSASFGPDTLLIQTSSNEGITYTTLKMMLGKADGSGELNTAPTIASAFTPTSSQWRPRIFALPVGTNKVKFRVKSGFGNNLYLDNICIQALASAVSNSIGLLHQGMFIPTDPYWRLEDTVMVLLHRTDFPNIAVDSAMSVPGANAVVNNLFFTRALSGTYYREVKHRNSIDTWSNVGVLYTRGGSSTHNFVPDMSAYANNEAIVSISPFYRGMYTGDVNRDKTVDLSDVSQIENAALNFTSGYVIWDLTGDGFVDINDIAIADNNSYNFVTEIAPPGAEPAPAPLVIYDSGNMTFENDAVREKFQSSRETLKQQEMERDALIMNKEKIKKENEELMKQRISNRPVDLSPTVQNAEKLKKNSENSSINTGRIPGQR